MGEKRVIDINDETARVLAQIITNDKALAILHALEDGPKSISELSMELGFPLSTVSYHIERMLRVGLVEVAGVKYGKRLQEVKLYRASNRPILLVPRRQAVKVTKKLPAIEKLHVISLSVAAFISALVYEASKKLLFPGPFVRNIGGVSNVSNVGHSPTPDMNSTLYVTTGSESATSRIIAGNSTAIKTINTSVVSTGGAPHTSSSTPIPVTSSPGNYTGSSVSPSGEGHGWVPLLLAFVAFVAVFLVSYYLLKRRIPKRF
ncbi:ArsR family transcriptional regulator [Thermococcus sp. Bubb.Bath]|nr:winged helix-turn-helix domain-containing protein [Thermococcus sp. Bubb.Bath]NJF24885.1 ArsR family transcriptional regulator [Thermococcus sp. Bubb.Bath]